MNAEVILSNLPPNAGMPSPTHLIGIRGFYRNLYNLKKHYKIMPYALNVPIPFNF